MLKLVSIIFSILLISVPIICFVFYGIEPESDRKSKPKFPKNIMRIILAVGIILLIASICWL